MSNPFERMNKSIFARLGEDAFLRGEACRADVTHGVEVAVASDYGQVTAHKTVVDIFYEGLDKPVSGNTVEIGGKSYKLDALLKDDAYSARWIVL